ncbi:MAG: choice-of-anchor L domain-containing protein [Burkholderiales bacterium]
MRAFFLAVLALLVSLVPAVDAGAARVAPARAAKIAPKIGSIATGATAAQLAAAIVGPGVTVSNATFTGAAAASGTFAGADADIGIASGVILSTGLAVDADGPNVSDGWSTDNGRPGDSDLSAIVGADTFDAAILEFDVVPAANTMSIRFVFASEEYPEFVDSEFNDVFAIFVNGVNCANFNGRPVAINSINEKVNSSFFVPNYTGARNTEFDGFTVPLDCVAAVNPGVPNHVKIAIADTSDEIYDAAVFLAAGGMRSPGTGALTGSNVTRVIEYYHADFDHYFMTAIPNEITLLDNGTLKGWSRTGHSFNVFVSGTPGTVDVCRFFSTAFGAKSSHFYTPYASECAIVKTNPNWQFEAAVFNMVLPRADGTCDVGLRPLYRVYNDGMGGAPNHRQVTDPSLFEMMKALGWKPEGQGVGVIACVPS